MIFNKASSYFICNISPSMTDKAILLMPIEEQNTFNTIPLDILRAKHGSFGHPQYLQNQFYVLILLKKQASLQIKLIISPHLNQNEVILSDSQSSLKSLKQKVIYIIKIMIIIIATLVLIFAIFVTYKFYVKPTRQIKRYVNIFRSLGYKVYEHPFVFMGVAIGKQVQADIKNHDDALYSMRIIYPQVDIVISNILDQIWVQLIDPQLIKTFLTGNTPYKYPKFQLTARGIKTFFGNGIAFVQGDAWKTKRKVLSKNFNFELIKENIPKIVQICNRALDYFEQTRKIGENTYQFPVSSYATRVFNNVMLKCFFGCDQIQGTFKGQSFAQFINNTIKEASLLSTNKLFNLFGKYAWKYGLTSPVKNIKERLNIIKQKSTQIVKEKTAAILKQPRKEKVTSMLESLIYQKLDNKEQVSLTDQQLIEEFQGFLAAGTELTSHFLNMMVYYVSRKPEKLKRLQEEINSVIKSDQDITYQNLKKLTYIDWIQLETTRMYGPGNGIMPRIAIEDNHINDVPISQGTVVTYNANANHFSSKYFKDPEEFRPERWESECNGIHPYAYIGFSGGMRTCIGKQFAYMQSKIALVKLFKRYDGLKTPEKVAFRIIFTYEPVPFDVVFTKNSAQ